MNFEINACSENSGGSNIAVFASQGPCCEILACRKCYTDWTIYCGTIMKDKNRIKQIY